MLQTARQLKLVLESNTENFVYAFGCNSRFILATDVESCVSLDVLCGVCALRLVSLAGFLHSVVLLSVCVGR